MPLDLSGLDVEDEELGLSGLLLSAGSRLRRRAHEQLSVCQRRQAHRRLVGPEIRMREQPAFARESLPDEQTPAGMAVSGCAGHDHPSPVRVGEEVVGSVDGLLAFVEQLGIAVLFAAFGGDPFP